jgi:phosphate starvation-inducible protein PhoH and related proteins
MSDKKYADRTMKPNKKPKKSIEDLVKPSSPEVFLYVSDECKKHVFSDALNEALKKIASFSFYSEGKNTYKFISTGKLDKLRAVVNVYEQAYRIVSGGEEVSEKDIEDLIKEHFKNSNDEQYKWNPNSIFEDTKGRHFTPRTDNQVALVHSIRTNTVTVVTGSAGSGKSTIALIMGLNALRDGRVDKMLIIRPLVAVGGEIGALPGDLLAKTANYMGPLYETLVGLIGKERLEEMIEDERIEFAPISFIRGANFHDCFCIVDEGQNLSKVEIVSLCSRICGNTKMVITGDESQIDLPYHKQKEPCSLTTLKEKLENIEGIGVVSMDLGDIQRSNIVRLLLEQFEADPPSKK